MIKGQSLLISAVILLPVAHSASVTGNLGATVVSEFEGARLVRRERHHRDRPQLADEDGTVNFCDSDFVMGNDGTIRCEDTSNHSLIEDRQMCREAAREASAKSDHADFEVDQTPYALKNSRPKGCFFMPCSQSQDTAMSDDDKKKACYFYNGIGNNPDNNVTGTPVCSRKKYMLGKPKTNGGTGEPNCPAGYTTLNAEPLCRTAANCLGDAKGANFLIGEHNASKHLDFSAHCFVDGTGANREGPNKVFYNNPDSGMTDAQGSKTGADGKVRGTPVCVVESSVLWVVENDAPKKTAKAINQIVTNNTDQSTHADNHGILDKPTPAPAPPPPAP